MRVGPSCSGGRSPTKYGGGSLTPAEAPLTWGGGNREESSRPLLSPTPPPQFCLDGCSREPKLQLPFSPALSPRCLRLLPLPLLPPAPALPAPPRPSAPPTCCTSWRHAHRAVADSFGTQPLAIAGPPLHLSCSTSPASCLRRGAAPAGQTTALPAPAARRTSPPASRHVGAGVSSKDGWGGP